jgi:hypothetical protein
MPMIVEQPAIAAASTAAMPTAPVPNTARLAPDGTASVFSTAPAPVWMPQPKGATTSSGMWLSIPITLRSRATEAVAKLDCPKKCPCTT